MNGEPDQVMHPASDSRTRQGRMRQRTGEESQGDTAEDRREAITEDQPATPTVDAGTVQQGVKRGIMPVMSPLPNNRIAVAHPSGRAEPSEASGTPGAVQCPPPSKMSFRL